MRYVCNGRLVPEDSFTWSAKQALKLYDIQWQLLFQREKTACGIPGAFLHESVNNGRPWTLVVFMNDSARLSLRRKQN